ncbi:MAG: hypothetical protein LC746_08285, partial [Acidobacteria bacterium]|nr:hypothetical protein [Acidobacteriota bacterium]
MRSATLPMALSLCAGLTLLAASGAAPARPQQHADSQGITNCDVKAYVVDRDPKGLNVRSAPGGTHKIIGNLPNRDVEGIRVHIT